MPIAFNCPQCRRALQLSDGLAGRQARCPYCTQMLVVPSLNSPAAQSQAPPIAGPAYAPPAAPAAGPSSFDDPKGTQAGGRGWYVRAGDEELGPLSVKELRERARRGDIHRDTPLRCGAAGKWTVAAKIKGLLPASARREGTGEQPSDPERLEETAADVFSVAEPSSGSTAIADDSIAAGEASQDSQRASPLPRQGDWSPPPLRAKRAGRHPLATRGHASGWFAALVRMLDLKFERYLTPTIIRVVWVLALVFGVCGLGYLLLSRVATALPQTSQVRQDRPSGIEALLDRLESQIDDKESEARRRSASSDATASSPRTPRATAPPAQASRPQPDPYASLTLEQLRAERDKLQKQYPLTRTVVSFTGLLAYGLLAVISAVSTVMSLLLCRVACEVLIVIFNIAASLVQIRHLLAAKARAEVPLPAEKVPPSPNPEPILDEQATLR